MQHVDKITLYTAPWCMPCKAYAPKVQALAEAHNIAFITKCIEDADTPQDIKSVPTVAMHYNGQDVFIAGAQIEAVATILANMGGD